MLDETAKLTIEAAAMQAAARLQANPEAVAYLAGSLAGFLPPALRVALVELITGLDSVLAARRLH